jgi:cell division protein FtsL
MAVPLRSRAPKKQSISTGRKSQRTPKLSVVAPRRRRWPAIFVGIAIFVVIGGMLGAAVFHTQLAQRQLEIDGLERSVDEARERFGALRRDRAVLRSPERIAEEATRLGMVRGTTNEFVSIDPDALARQIAAGGVVSGDVVRVLDDADPLDQFRDVKAVSAGQP